VKERPILFKPEMVRAILEGRKTQTRRTVKLNRVNEKPDIWKYRGINGLNSHLFEAEIMVGDPDAVFWIEGPYGVPGDRLWVRETFAIETNFNIEFKYEPPHKDGRPIKWEESPEWGKWWAQPHYRATDPTPDLCYEDQAEDGPCVKWKPSIHMPRWASRLTLEVTHIRVERVRDISAKDIISEGAVLRPHTDQFGRNPVSAFDEKVYLDLRSLWAAGWNSINEKRGYGWDNNPWVWVIEFKEIKP